MKKGLILVLNETQKEKYRFKMGESISFNVFYDRLKKITII